MSASPARSAALEVVRRVRERRAYAHETLDAVLGGRRLDQRDRALATRLAYGAIAARGTLDEVLDRVLDPGTELEPRVRDALVLGTWEVLFGATPVHAAASETVELVRATRPRAAGLANAAMRRVITAASDFPWGDPETDDAALARLHGHPRWLAELWITERGRRTAAQMMAADNLPAPLFLASLDTPVPRLVEELEAAGASPEPGPVEGSLRALVPAAARESRLVRERKVLVMDAAAQLAVHALRAEPGMRIVEVGAGRGGKSLLSAARARSRGGPAQITAVDLSGSKLRRLSQAAAELGFEEITTLATDAASPTAFLGIDEGSADAVLVDAPCSGLGTLRRHPDRRWRASPDELGTLAAIGARLLGRASSLVKPGGFVVYSTCTIARVENESVIEGFLGSEAGEAYRVDPLGNDVPEEWRGFVTPEGWFQSLPAVDGPDGHFIARLLRA